MVSCRCKRPRPGGERARMNHAIYEKLRLLMHWVLLRFDVDLVPVGLVPPGSPSYRQHTRNAISEAGMLLNGCEAYQLMAIAAASAKVPGAMAEVGVYRGASAKLICEVSGSRTVHLFDTFDGLPVPTSADGDVPFRAGDFKSRYEEVRQYLKPYQSAHVYKGV